MILRLNKLRQKMVDHQIEALLAKSNSNVYYLSGFTGTNATLFITLSKCYLLTDFRYTEQAGNQSPDFEIMREDQEPLRKISELARGLNNIGIEEEAISWADYRKTKEMLRDCDLRYASEILRELRQVKDESEIAILRQAIQITDEAFLSVIDKIKPGAVEAEISLELEISLRRLGASGRSFDYIVASGKRSAMPHGVASTKKIETNELVTLDFGAIYKMYCSDLTRTIFVGHPEAKHREIYDIVLEAQQTAIRALKPGMTGKEADGIARDVISQAGYGDYFGHGLGHSLGIDIHENPRLNTRENKVLEQGMVVTVEPGIYIPDWGGVRIEDVVLVTNFGVEVLTRAPKQFIIID